MNRLSLSIGSIIILVNILNWLPFIGNDNLEDFWTKIIIITTFFTGIYVLQYLRLMFCIFPKWHFVLYSIIGVWIGEVISLFLWFLRFQEDALISFYVTIIYSIVESIYVFILLVIMNGVNILYTKYESKSTLNSK